MGHCCPSQRLSGITLYSRTPCLAGPNLPSLSALPRSSLLAAPGGIYTPGATAKGQLSGPGRQQVGSMAAGGQVVAAVHSGSERLLEVRLPATGKASDNILELKKQTMAFMTDFLKQQNMSTEEGGSGGPGAAPTQTLC